MRVPRVRLFSYVRVGKRLLSDSYVTRTLILSISCFAFFLLLYSPRVQVIEGQSNDAQDTKRLALHIIGKLCDLNVSLGQARLQLHHCPRDNNGVTRKGNVSGFTD